MHRFGPFNTAYKHHSNKHTIFWYILCKYQSNKHNIFWHVLCKNQSNKNAIFWHNILYKHYSNIHNITFIDILYTHHGNKYTTALYVMNHGDTMTYLIPVACSRGNING